MKITGHQLDIIATSVGAFVTSPAYQEPSYYKTTFPGLPPIVEINLDTKASLVYKMLIYPIDHQYICCNELCNYQSKKSPGLAHLKTHYM